ncbi:ARM repeat-containing protein [Aspergillus karnatakaensis]|uniref:putative translation elongation factor eEF-3 n=1 Tax=Aspergillus karnatakaensis TaxID=1810916 RepID=UPI003CCE254D
MPAVDVASVPAVSGKETAQSVAVLEDLFKNLSVASSQDEVNAAANNLAHLFSGPIPEQTLPLKAVETFEKQLAEKKDATIRERALDAIRAIASHATISPAVEPHLVSLLEPVLVAAGNKKATPKEYQLAEDTALAIVQGVNANAVKAILPVLIKAMAADNRTGHIITGIKCFEQLVESSPVQLSYRVPDLIPVLADAVHFTDKKINSLIRSDPPSLPGQQTAADKDRKIGLLEKVCNLVVNKDIEKFIPQVAACIADPKEKKIAETVHLLGATTFVSDVTGPTLAIMTPLLARGLESTVSPSAEATAVKRKSAVIIDNMSKLVEDPQIVAPFMPLLRPKLEHNVSTIANSDANKKSRDALETLLRVGGVENGGPNPQISTAGDIATISPIIKDILTSKIKGSVDSVEAVITYISAIAGQLVDEQVSEIINWTQGILPFLTTLVGEAEAKPLVDTIRKRTSPVVAAGGDVLSDEEEGEDLCNCTFSLAYGAKTLLNQTALRLKRGQRYGLLGPNGSGKTTLMRAINNEQLEGFPKKDEVKTVYVEHDLDSADTEQTVIGWTIKKLRDVGLDPNQSEVEAKLLEFGFLREQFEGPITALSGGWKMKLALCRAVFEAPDILLLDEPTNHLDVKNVAWLENYLINSPCTSIIVSHDSKFLDHVIQHVVHYERFKLKRYRGNLSEFVKRVPSARSYYELGASDLEFKFPEPGFLEGVKTKAKAIIRVSDMSFQYPNTPKPQITDINFQISLGSRIAVIGPNGAGKSTLVNVLTGELLPTTGEVYQHENIRIAYIKQHAFAHIDHHLEKTPSQYIQWRFQTGEDRETMDRANKIITEDDEKAMLKIYKIEGSQRRVIGVHGRRKFKNTYEYECSFSLGENIGMKNEKWTPMSTTENAWIPRNEIIESHQKEVAKVDEEEARKNSQFRNLVTKDIEEHCEQFGLDAELVSHSRMLGLSGGQRVKVVLAACTWQRPHVIVLDEPTNYLDRDSLGALSKALKKFEGGVVVITHSAEFTENLTEEVWAVLDGKMTPSGHNWVQGQGSGPRLEAKEGPDEIVDAMGNKTKVEKKKILSSGDKRKLRKERLAKKKRGEDVDDDEDF